MPRTRDTRQQVQEVVDEVHGVASKNVDVNDKAQNSQKTISDAAATVQNAPGAAQNGVQNAMNTVQSYVHEGQRFASEHKAQLQEVVKKAVNVAHEYVEDARKKADPYVESAKAKVDSARASVENARHSAQSAVDNAKGQVTAVRTKVTAKTQPYVSNYLEFDVTKTATFHVITHIISSVLYIAWRLTQLIPSAQHMINVIQQKEAHAAVTQNCATVVQKVPVVGPRAVEVATILVNNVCTNLSEQILQYTTAVQRPKTA
ncbi:conserved hypothetical protein [Leishmania mexicana MHOM/GT/2001/U1103]|uniref:Uncharacterized protein n=1 Tax=Leishmania mexicana (strain MHOM/GT/2001/U1103) TaxID=929439 RepID=E9AVK2_LEIMU|nr:conserved hypothetical protein [Leishmania mexicana MHOM/GT/2001/U1103]CBZ26985.1 conserved hypothetical protein [Leishmania mexicana MHOM/GT/2001/U1103]